MRSKDSTLEPSIFDMWMTQDGYLEAEDRN